MIDDEPTREEVEEQEGAGTEVVEEVEEVTEEEEEVEVPVKPIKKKSAKKRGPEYRWVTKIPVGYVTVKREDVPKHLRKSRQYKDGMQLVQKR